MYRQPSTSCAATSRNGGLVEDTHQRPPKQLHRAISLGILPTQFGVHTCKWVVLTPVATAVHFVLQLSAKHDTDGVQRLYCLGSSNCYTLGHMVP